MPKRQIKQSEYDRTMNEFNENVKSFIEASKYTGRSFNEQLQILIDDCPSQEVYWKLLCQKAKERLVQ